MTEREWKGVFEYDIECALDALKELYAHVGTMSSIENIENGDELLAYCYIKMAKMDKEIERIIDEG